MTRISKLSLLLAGTLIASTLCISAETPKATASVDPICPVELTQLRIDHNKLIFNNRNSSGMYIKKVALGAAYFDNSNVQHTIEVQGGWKDLHAGYILESALDIKPYRKTGYAGWTIWPEKVLFSDGSLWQINHATTSCALQTWKSNQVALNHVPVQVSSIDSGRGK